MDSSKTIMDSLKNKIKKRFIAGAVCPHCKALDTVVVYRQDGADFRACTACDFLDEMRFVVPVRELQTRVNVTAQQVAAETQPVKWLDDLSDANKI